MKICVTKDNFESSITSLKSKSFVDEDIIYRFLYDSLNVTKKQYLAENDLPKNKILIYLKKPDGKSKIKIINDAIILKYKNQIKYIETIKEDDIRNVLNDIFRGVKNKNELANELSKFDGRYILRWLDSISISSYEVARKSAEIERYVYSQFFPFVVVYNLYNCKAIVQWIKK